MEASLSPQGRRITVRGVVQGVGFRPWVYRAAREAGIAGRVRNDAAGVTIEAFGPVGVLDGFVARLRGEAPPGASIRSLESEEIPLESPPDFAIEKSRPEAERHVSIPPDLATCDLCLRDVRDPLGRRHRYAFTNCTQCGPRFTIACDLPYDRAATTMAAFVMCPECREEYESPLDRRFHAQPNACPRCGPRLRLLDASGPLIADRDPLATTAAVLRMGGIVAVKGLGGYHLACDATNRQAVSELRRRKRREEKPFAVMVADVRAAEREARLSEVERALLASTARPIVLVPRRAGASIAPEVAPRSPILGLLLPYTPLHHLLLEEAGRPLVMTSGNLSEEPLAFEDGDALARLGGIADCLLGHDRKVAAPCDDSVAQVVLGAPMLLRRARGYVPHQLALAREVARPVLACGAQLKNTFCVAAGRSAHLGPHVGDLENLETFAAYEAAIERTLRFLRVQPELCAHDLHPGYLSTEYALQRPEATRIGVQHHHAHVVSAMAEHGLAGPVLGVAYDGTGYGTDGRAWGGELLLAREAGFERLATLRPIPLAGGDLAIRQPWRLALALVDDACGAGIALDRLALFHRVKPEEVALVRRMIASGVNAPLAHGAGRYFDALGALALARPRSAYEGQVALEWNLAADAGERGQYGFEVAWEDEPWTIDLRPMVRAAVADLLAQTPAPLVSARFHNTLIAATARVLRRALHDHGRRPVVFCGGCFQNRRLAEGLAGALGPEVAVHLPRMVPPGDGGIALGQALVADAVARASRRG